MRNNKSRDNRMNIRKDSMSNDNTKPEFFALWSVRDLQVECARLNKVLQECIEILEEAK